MVDQHKLERLRSLIEEIQESPGQKILDEIDGVKRSFRVMYRNYDALIQALDALENGKNLSTLWNVENREIRHEGMEVITTHLHNFLAAAFGLVDHVRRHREHLYANHNFQTEIAANLKNIILDSGEHFVAQGLRVFCLHVGLPNISFTLQGTGEEELESSFRLGRDILLEWDGWPAKGRKFLNDATEDIRLRSFVEAYFIQVKEFYEWLWTRQGELHASEIEDSNVLRDRARELQNGLYGETLGEVKAKYVDAHVGIHWGFL